MVTVEFKGNNNNYFDLVVTEFDQRKRAEEQIEQIEIEGRSGTLVDRYGTFRSYERKITFVNLKKHRQAEIHKWLSGAGLLRTTEDPFGFFRANVLNVVERDYIGGHHSLLSVTFLVEPFFYLDVGQETVTVASQKSLFNIGNYMAEPIITVFGSGNGAVTINSKTVTLTSVQQYLTMDSKLQVVHKDGLPAGRKMAGAFPALEEGKNVISFSGAVTSLEVVPNWREL